jgi:hypothetical protein
MTAKIKGGGFGLLRIDELGATAKVIGDEQFYLSHTGSCTPDRVIGFATVLPWPLTRDVADSVGGVRSWSKASVT